MQDFYLSQSILLSTTEPTSCSESCSGRSSLWLHLFTLCELTSLAARLAQHFILVGTGQLDQTEHRSERRRLSILIHRDEDFWFLSVVSAGGLIPPSLHAAIPQYLSPPAKEQLLPHGCWWFSGLFILCKEKKSHLNESWAKALTQQTTDIILTRM